MVTKKKSYGFILLIFLFSTQNISAVDITGKEAEAYFGGEFNRSFNYDFDISAIGSIELNKQYTFRGGFSLGVADMGAQAGVDIDILVSAKYLPFLDLPLYFSLVYIYNGLPVYETHTHSILPVVSFNINRAGVSVGQNFRFSSFFSEIAQFESVFTFYVYFNFINNDSLKIGVAYGNLNDFQAKNLGDLTLSFYSSIRLNDNWHVLNDIEFMQSGVDGLSTNFYGFAWRTGAKFSW